MSWKLMASLFQPLKKNNGVKTVKLETYKADTHLNHMEATCCVKPPSWKGELIVFTCI